MPYFTVIIETKQGYSKRVEADSEAEAIRQVENDSDWGSPASGWEPTDDVYAAIERVER